jgi:hypothetical protein
MHVAGVRNAKTAASMVRRRRVFICVLVICEQERIEANSEAMRFLKDLKTNVEPSFD